MYLLQNIFNDKFLKISISLIFARKFVKIFSKTPIFKGFLEMLQIFQSLYFLLNFFKFFQKF